jgi:hypothetical protein
MAFGKKGLGSFELSATAYQGSEDPIQPNLLLTFPSFYGRGLFSLDFTLTHSPSPFPTLSPPDLAEQWIGRRGRKGHSGAGMLIHARGGICTAAGSPPVLSL